MFFLDGERFCTDSKVRCGNCAAFFSGDSGQPDGSPEINSMVKSSGRGACKRRAPQTTIHIIRQSNAIGQQQNTILNTPAFPLVHPDNKCMDFVPKAVEHKSSGIEIVEQQEVRT